MQQEITNTVLLNLTLKTLLCGPFLYPWLCFTQLGRIFHHIVSLTLNFMQDIPHL